MSRRLVTSTVSAVLAVCAIVLVACRQPSYQEGRAGRLEFFDELMEKTERRTAWSKPKWDALGTTFEREVARLGLREEFGRAETERQLALALSAFSNARRDSHVRVRIEPYTNAWMYAPIRFLPDLSGDVNDVPNVFVANFDDRAKSQGAKRGDLLVQVDGEPARAFQLGAELNSRGSTRAGAYVRRLGGAGHRPGLLSAIRPGAEDSVPVVYTLADCDSGEEKTIKLEYSVHNNTVEWSLDPILVGYRRGEQGEASVHYDGFYRSLGYRRVPLESETLAALWLDDDRKLALIELFGFDDVVQGVEAIAAAALAKDALGYDVIIDATHASGGRDAQLLVGLLTDEPFRPTYGNVRVTDAKFVRRHAWSRGRAVRSWVETAIGAGDDYTSAEPFKLRYDPELQPAAQRFSGGNKVLLLFPWGGSQLDQFAAMVVDQSPSNGIHSIGTTAGGYSNTWEWGETLDPPGPLKGVEFEWSVGHTIRPNGEVLEGNPARADDWFPMTAENADGYFKALVQRAEIHLLEQR